MNHRVYFEKPTYLIVDVFNLVEYRLNDVPDNPRSLNVPLLIVMFRYLNCPEIPVLVDVFSEDGIRNTSCCAVIIRNHSNIGH